MTQTQLRPTGTLTKADESDLVTALASYRGSVRDCGPVPGSLRARSLTQKIKVCVDREGDQCGSRAGEALAGVAGSATLGSLIVRRLTRRVKVCVSRDGISAGPGPARPWWGVAGQSPANNNPPSAPARASGDGLGFAQQNAPTKSGSQQYDHRKAVTCVACEPRSGEVGLGRKPR